MGLLFLLIPKKYHPSSYDATMTSQCKHALEILKTFTITDNIHIEKAKIDFLLKIVETCNFHGMLGKLSKTNANSNPHTK